MKHETVQRSLVKTIIFRLIMTLLTSVVLWIMGRDVWQALGESVVVNLCLTVCYYINERVWANIDWGFK